MTSSSQPWTFHVGNESETCTTCRLAREAIHEFLRNGDYEHLAEDFEFLRSNDPSGTAHLDRWQVDAALLSGTWDAAWSFRHLGLLEHNHRIMPEDIINVRALCEDTSLSAQDVNLIVLSENGLTPWGTEHIQEINAKADEYLQQIYADVGGNVVQALYEWLSAAEPTSAELETLADQCDYALDVDQLRRQIQSERHMLSVYQESALKQGGDIVSIQMYEWRVSPNMWCFQPTQGKFVEALPIGIDDHGRVKVRDHPRFPYTRVPGWIGTAMQGRIRALFRRCENEVRKNAGLPEIGEGWVGETTLFREIARAFPGLPTIQHARPSWLAPQHFDVYLPTCNIAVEYQGCQHFEPIEFFGGEEAFRKTRERDMRKRQLCRRHGCFLIEVAAGYNLAEVIEQISTGKDR